MNSSGKDPFEKAWLILTGIGKLLILLIIGIIVWWLLSLFLNGFGGKSTSGGIIAFITIVCGVAIGAWVALRKTK